MIGPHPVEWLPGQPPRSALFGDVFHSAEGGLAEARQVFLDGCGLPEAWSGRQRYCIAELGFGVGRNMAAALDLWARAGPAEGRLSLFSIEAFPVSAKDAARALAAFPELAAPAAALLSRWPGLARGFHRLDLPAYRATLDVAVMDVGEALAAWSGQADAWFLDGFAPRLNPDMWRAQILEQVAAHSAPGARLATYAAAGEVRRGLVRAGFEVTRAPGFAGKREQLRGQLAGASSASKPAPRVAIIGAGIAGASLKRAFDALGVRARVIDAGAPCASAGPAALVSPRLDAGLGPAAALHAQAFARARQLYGSALSGEAALQLAVGPKDARRFAVIAGAELFEAGAMVLRSASEASRMLGEPAPAALAIAGAGVIAPAEILRSWLGVARISAEVARIVAGEGCWRLVRADGSPIAEAEIVCVAAAMASTGLVGGLPLSPVRGQASFAQGQGGLAGPVLFGGYAAPGAGGILFGATHDRGQVSLDVRPKDHARNLAALGAALPELAMRLAAARMAAHVGVRATTPDYLPLAGPAPGAGPGLFVLTGLGSRGFSLSPLLAEHLAARALGVPSPLPGPLAELVDPGRFARRAGRREASL
jgi:tRNA 5-methylaminomethyl-2-thiouridine biosynthesis bifunctional protein